MKLGQVIEYIKREYIKFYSLFLLYATLKAIEIYWN